MGVRVQDCTTASSVFIKMGSFTKLGDTMQPAPLRSAIPETISYPLTRLLTTALLHKLLAGDYIPRQYPPTLTHRADSDK